MRAGRGHGDRKDPAAAGSAAGIGGVRSTLASSLPSRLSRAGVGAAAMHCAPVALALFTCGYMLRGGVLLFGFVNLTLVFLLATILCVGVHLLATRQVGFQLIWADLGMIAFAVLLLANSRSDAGLEKGLRFVVLVLAPYFLARVILTDFVHVRRFLITVAATVTVLAIGAFAFSVLPDPVAELLPYRLVEWNRRLVFMEVSAVHMGSMLMVGTMIYIGLISGWRRIWMIPGLAMIWVLIYGMLATGTRAVLISILATTLLSVSIALITRRSSNLPILLIVFGTTALILYTFVASGLAPPTPIAAKPAAPDKATASAAAKPAAPVEATSRIRLPRIGITLPNQERFETLAVAIGEIEDPKKKRLVDRTMSGRIELLGTALTRFKENPLLGAGTAGMERYAHNIFMETAAELGLVGLVLLSTVLVFVLRSLWKFFIELDQRNPHFHVVTAVFLAATALFIQKQFSNGLTHHKDLIIFVAVILNLPLLLGIRGQEGAEGIRERVPPRLRFLAPAKDSVP